MINKFNDLIATSTETNDAFNLPTQEIKWTDSLKKRYKKRENISLDSGHLVISNYRPFFQQHLYLSTYLNERRGRTENYFRVKNSKAIVFSGTGSSHAFSCLMSDKIPCLDFIEKSQVLPLSIVSKRKNNGLFSSPNVNHQTQISGVNLNEIERIKNCYSQNSITDDDYFYYIYGIFHAPYYRERFRNNLSKSTPRIPLVKSFDQFLFFSKVGRELSDLHTDFENVEMHPIQIAEGDLRLATIDCAKNYFRVEKMKFATKGDKSSVIYNKNITIERIPLEAYEYIVSSKSALEWVMERQCVKTDKASGITNDANDYANETMNNPKYPLELFRRIITVSLKTMKIVKSLPELDID